MKVFHYTEFIIRRFWRNRKIGLLFDMYAWIQVYKNGNPNIDNVVYYAAISFCKEKGKKVTFTQGDISGWLEKITKKEYEDIISIISESSADVGKGQAEKKK